MFLGQVPGDGIQMQPIAIKIEVDQSLQIVGAGPEKSACQN